MSPDNTGPGQSSRRRPGSNRAQPQTRTWDGVAARTAQLLGIVAVARRLDGGKADGEEGEQRVEVAVGRDAGPIRELGLPRHETVGLRVTSVKGTWHERLSSATRGRRLTPAPEWEAQADGAWEG